MNTATYIVVGIVALTAIVPILGLTWRKDRPNNRSQIELMSKEYD